MLILSNPGTPIAHPDYFSTLSISVDSDLHAVHAAYHKLAPQTHPEASTGDSRRFRHLAEAYSVLSDPRLRPIYETFGYIGLHKGVSAPTLEFPGWAFTADPLEVYEDFFGSKKLLLPSMDFSLASPGIQQQSPALITELVLSLESWFLQGVHEVAFMRKTLSKADMRTVVEEPGKVRIDLRRATSSSVGCRLMFPGEGHWIHPLSSRGDLVILVKVARHKTFTTVRGSSDLMIDYSVSLSQALSGFNSEITGVDGAALVIPVWDVVESGKTLRVSGQGLKRADGERGDLIITFKVNFPSSLSDHQVDGVKRLFSRSIHEHHKH